MTKQLKFTSLLLLVASLTFAQKPQSVYNTSKSNVKDRVAVDTVKKPVAPTTQTKSSGVSIIGATGKTGQAENLVIVSDSTKKRDRIKKGEYTFKKDGKPISTGTIEDISDKGEVQLTIKQAGNYTLTLVSGASSSGNAKTETVPVVGATVKCGKKPGASYIDAGTTNDKGEVELKNLTAGSYTILVQAPCPFGHEWRDGKCVQVGDRTNNSNKQN